ncbi:DUF4282 domain-containing protein [Orenia marismortui]|uniref:Uncharacterized protein DUF4282 n=1 Tax=Orenia marismortui TaxID=46469 RepID=A0A4R8GDJ3_9FIRM|nr:DUF4282 domain-containing protein [Orenia marismortui]TDX43620.1 uncharacterized protein DUF4282 [Orenia marismortui]
MNEYLKFKKMISPIIIQAIFWIGVVVSILVGLGTMISGFSSPYGGGMTVFMGLMILVVGPLSVRIYCEMLILFFKLNDSINEINEKLDS